MVLLSIEKKQKKLFNKVHNLDECHEELKFYKEYRDKILTPKKEKDAIVDVFAPEKEKANDTNEMPQPSQQEPKASRGKKSNERTTQNN